MNYFLCNLLCHVLMLIVFIILIVLFNSRNIKRRTGNPFVYFMPVIFAVISILYIIFIIFPRFMDISTVVTNTGYKNTTGVVNEVSALKNYIIVDGVRYYTNPQRNKVNAGDNVKFKSTVNSNYVINLSKVKDTSVG